MSHDKALDSNGVPYEYHALGTWAARQLLKAYAAVATVAIILALLAYFLL